jgi:hypothetical protein
MSFALLMAHIKGAAFLVCATVPEQKEITATLIRNDLQHGVPAFFADNFNNISRSYCPYPTIPYKNDEPTAVLYERAWCSDG